MIDETTTMESAVAPVMLLAEHTEIAEPLPTEENLTEPQTPPTASEQAETELVEEVPVEVPAIIETQEPVILTETPQVTEVPTPTTIQPPPAIAIVPPTAKSPKYAFKGVANLGELDELEVLRTELASSTFKPKVILSYEKISFNKACVNLLPNTHFVNVLIDRTKKRIIIIPRQGRTSMV